MTVCHETIYRFAYSRDGQTIKLWHYLPERRARRRPRHARRQHGRRFNPELRILHRPDSVYPTLSIAPMFIFADRFQFAVRWQASGISGGRYKQQLVRHPFSNAVQSSQCNEKTSKWPEGQWLTQRAVCTN